jgi:hypothetical protein
VYTVIVARTDIIHLALYYYDRYKNAQILLQNGVGDSTVTPLAGRVLARNINASLLSVST